MAFQHPALQEMLKLGCTDRLKISTAFQTYMKLCEVDRLWNVQFLYNKHLDIIYITSSDNKHQVLHIPLPVHYQISPMWISSVTRSLREEHQNAEVNIVIKTPDSSLLTYKVGEGLSPPPNPDTTKEKKAIKERIQYVQSELNKSKSDLYEEAKKKLNKSTETCGSSSRAEEVKMEEDFSGEEL